jgi:hypothetical protein
MGLKIVRGQQQVPFVGVIYSGEGLGKTTFASKAPRPLFLDTERGTRQLDVDRIDITDWTDLLGAINSLCRDAQGYQTIVVDTIDWAERLAVEAILRTSGKRSIEDFGFGKGYVHLAEYVGRLLQGCDSLVEHGLNVILLAHAKVARISPPDQTDGYDRYELKLSKQVSPLIKEWPDALLFANYRTIVKEGNDGRHKAIGGRERMMHCNRSAAWDAKNRYGLPDVLPFDFDQVSHLFASNDAPITAGTLPAIPPAALREAPAGTVHDDAPLAIRVATHIAQAANVRTLGRIGDRIDALASEGQLTADEAAELTAAIDRRHAELEPREVANG